MRPSQNIKKFTHAKLCKGFVLDSVSTLMFEMMTSFKNIIKNMFSFYM
jgi:hypothetical protein